MKRTIAQLSVMAGTVVGLSGCLSPNATSQKQAMNNPQAPVQAATDTKPRSTGFIQLASFMSPAESQPQSTGVTRTMSNPQMANRVMVDPTIQRVNHTNPNFSPYPPEVLGPMQSKIGMMMGHGGILPTPGQVAPGAVAGVGFAGPGTMGAAYSNQRTSVRFANPPGMKVAFMEGMGFSESARIAPFNFNFLQSNIYRMRLTEVPMQPGKSFYPTLEVYPATLKTVTFLSHSTVPVAFTDEDFTQAALGNLVVKVIYLPDPQFQDLAAAEEIVSTRLESGVDPIAEANRRGTILAVIRLGNIDLENKTSPRMEDLGMSGQPRMMMPGSRMMPAPAPVSPAPGTPAGMPKIADNVPNDLPSVKIPVPSGN